MLHLSERLKASRLGAARPWRRLTSWSLLPSTIDGLVLVPNDLETTDPGFVAELAGGQMGLDGAVVDFGRGSPFVVAEAPQRWQLELNRFRWLRHLRAAGTPQATDQARRLVADWIARNRRPQGAAWRPDVAVPRVVAWLRNAGLLLDGAEPRLYREVLASLGAQIRRLDGMRHRLPPGPIRLECRVALLEAALACDAAERHVARIERELGAELGRQVLADGCHVGRNPGEVLRLLALLLPMRQCLLARGRDVPMAIEQPVKRMVGFLGHVRLGDGTLVRANGQGLTRTDLLSTVLNFGGEPQVVADAVPAGGYVRLEAGGTVLVVDAGRAPPLTHATAAHAGCLAFEMTAGGLPLLRNCGAPAAGPAADAYTARATASHNTLALGARSSSRLVGSGRLERRLGGRPVSGPARVGATVEATPDGPVLTADHDGYEAEHGIVHRRRLALSADGARLEGRDTLGPRAGVLRLPQDLPFAIHFHLGPGVAARLDADGQGATLVDGDGIGWRLACTGARASLEASVDYAHVSGARAGRQVVLRGVCPGEAAVDWSLARTGPA